MKLIPFAIIIARMTGLYFTLAGVLEATYLPERIYSFLNSAYQRHFLADLTLRLLVLRIVLHFLFGSALWIWARPLADKLTWNLETAPESPAS